MNKQSIALGVALVAIVIALASFAAQSGKATQADIAAALQSFGGVTNYDELTLKAPSGTTTLAVYGSSSSFGGCYETNATSTATKIKLLFSTLGATSTFSGTVYWAYGTCK